MKRNIFVVFFIFVDLVLVVIRKREPAVRHKVEGEGENWATCLGSVLAVPNICFSQPLEALFYLQSHVREANLSNIFGGCSKFDGQRSHCH